MKRPIVSLLAFLLLGAGCATEPEPLDQTQPDALHKEMFSGEWYYKLTVVDTEWANKATFIGEEAFFGSAKVRWEITEDKLNAYMLPQRYRDKDGKMVENAIGLEAMALSFPIKRHFDIKYQENTTTREELNVIVENDTDRPWWEREYIRVDWSESKVTNMWAPMSTDMLLGELIREPVSTWENVEFFDEHDNRISTRNWRPDRDPDVVAMNIDTKESIRSSVDFWWEFYYGYVQPPVTVKWRHSLLKVGNRDYQEMDYRDDFFRRFGYFRTEYEVYDPERAVRESDKRYFINRWNTDDGRQIVFTLSPSFPAHDKDLVAWTEEVVAAWNKAMQEATGRKDDVVVLRHNEPLYDAKGHPVFNTDGSERWRYELGDMRYSFINYTTRPQDASPLGYGPSFADPDTGEIISAAVNVYGNWVDFVVTRAMDLYDLVAGNCTTDDVRVGHYFNEETGKCDGGVVDGDLRSEMARPGGEPVVAGQGPGEAENPVEFMTPAMMASYFPRSNIQLPASKLTREQLEASRPRLQALLQASATRKIPLNLTPLQALEGTAYESMMVPHASLHAVLPGARSSNDPAVVAAIGATSRLSEEALAEMKYQQYLSSLHCRLEPDHFDPAIVAFVQKYRDKDRAWIKRELRHWIYYNTTLHEMGHTLGLRHNFRGSMDRPNFHAHFEDAWQESWESIEELRAVYNPRIQQGDAEAYRQYVEAARQVGSEVARYSSSSIMDYTGDWDVWLEDRDGKPGLPDYDRAALLFGYGHKVEVLDGKDVCQACDQGGGCPDGAECASGICMVDGQHCLTSLVYQEPAACRACDNESPCPDGSVCSHGYCYHEGSDGCLHAPGSGRLHYSQWPWKVVPYKEGDLEMATRFDPLALDKNGRVVRFYEFCSDEKVFDDAFCTRFDRGTTATEIVRNMIEEQYRGYFFKNFKRDNAGFDGRRSSYFINKWLWTYYMMAKFLGQMTIHSMWYPETWSSFFDAIEPIYNGPEDRMMIPGTLPTGGEDLMRATLLAYHYMVYDVLMRPDYGYYSQTVDKSGRTFWSPSMNEPDPLDPQPMAQIPVGPGWGWAEQWDSQSDTTIYYDHLTRIGVELDKIMVLEVMSIPAALNDILAKEKANGISFWNSLWTGDGQELWEVMRGLITDVHTHPSNPWCISADGQLNAYPVSLLEGLIDTGVITGVDHPQVVTRCPEGSYPVEPGMDALFAIYPIFWSIAGSSHPWYNNALADRLEAQIKGGNHRFDIPEGAEYAEFTNASGTRTWQAVQTEDGMSIAYDLVSYGRDIMDRIRFLEACAAREEPREGTPGTYGRTCDEVQRGCGGYRVQDWCASEGWSSVMGVIDLPGSFKYRDVDRVEAMLIMMQDMVDIAGHYAWRVPGILEDP